MFHITPPYSDNATNSNVRNANAASPIPNKEVSNVEFGNVIQMYSQIMTNQNNPVHAHVNENGGSVVARVFVFVSMNAPEFLGSQAYEDSQNLLDKIKKIFKVMHVTWNDPVELPSYQLKDVSHIWYTQWKENRGANGAPITWYCFSETFLDSFFPIEISNRVVEMARKVSRSFQIQHLHLLVFHPQRTSMSKRCRSPGSKSQGSVSGTKTYLTFPMCACHRLRDCPSREGQGGGNGRSWSTTSTAPRIHPTQQGNSSGTGCGMDLLHSWYALDHCRIRIVHFKFPYKPILEWKGSDLALMGRFIPYLKARNVISKGYVYHLIRVMYSSSETQTLKSVPVVYEFQEVFPEDLHGVHPEIEINFGIDLIPNTQPISIPPYRMAPAELKEFKEKLKDLLERASSDLVFDHGLRQYCS
ncbi:hypothetical protein EJD97_007966 [Solanum chilense]|uniref:Uncharacterized protein n=1 Tax=Solanum chilense TaxID=4083 RepID=A0A6N2CG38_SOLCI|nr:hypothetical protein EJD97_007966 [Solanum chilense]